MEFTTDTEKNDRNRAIALYQWIDIWRAEYQTSDEEGFPIEPIGMLDLMSPEDVPYYVKKTETIKQLIDDNHAKKIQAWVEHQESLPNEQRSPNIEKAKEIKRWLETDKETLSKQPC